MGRKEVARKERPGTQNRITKIVGYRLGIYDPDPDVDRIEWVGKAVRCSRANMTELRAAVEEFNRIAERDPTIESCLGIFRVSG